MISAEEAKKLYDDSGHEVELFIKNNVEKFVIGAAKSGKRNLTVFLGSCGPYDSIDRVVTPLNKAVESKLKALGYTVFIGCYGNKYVPIALSDEDGNGPIHQNFGLHISW